MFLTSEMYDGARVHTALLEAVPGVELCPERHVEAPTPAPADVNVNLWKYGPCRRSHVDTRSCWFRAGPAPVMRLSTKRTFGHRKTQTHRRTPEDGRGRDLGEVSVTKGREGRRPAPEAGAAGGTLQRPRRERGPVRTSVSDFRPPDLRGNELLSF